MNEQGSSSARNPPRHATLPRRRWRIAWLLGIGVLVNFFDRVNLSVSHDSLIAAFGISDVVFGYLSSAYNWTYALCQLPIGVVLDKLGVRRVGRIGTFLWSAASFAAAVAPNLSAFFGARLLLGVGESPTFPANAKAIGLWFPARERSLATSLYDAAAKFASAIGVPVIGIVLIHAGWRWSFAFTGAISFAYFLLFWRVYRDPAEDPELTEIERLYIEDRDGSLAAPDSRRGALIFAGPSSFPAQGPWPRPRLRRVQLRLFPAALLAAGISVLGSAYRSAALVPVHQRAVVPCHRDGPRHRRLAGRLPRASAAGMQARSAASS